MRYRWPIEGQPIYRRYFVNQFIIQHSRSGLAPVLIGQLGPCYFT